MTDKNSQEILLSLVIPVYNYENKLRENIERIIKEFKKKQIIFELILVNDGSTDDTETIIKELSMIYSEIKLISYPKNRGKGYAVKQGVLTATGKIIFFTDVDLPYGLEPILYGLKLIKIKGYDIVLGSRDLFGFKKKLFYNWKRQIAHKIFSLIVNFILSIDINDTQCGLKGFKKEVAKKIFPQLTRNGFSFDIEVIYLARKNKFNIKLIPVYLEHFTFSSTISLWHDSLKMLIDIFAIKYNILFNKYK